LAGFFYWAALSYFFLAIVDILIYTRGYFISSNILNFNNKIFRCDRCFKSIVSNFPLPIKIINKDLSIDYVNSAFCDITGYKKAELIGVEPPFPWWTQSEDWFDGFDIRNIPINTSRTAERVINIRNQDKFWVKIAYSRFTNEEGEDQIIVTWVDISKRKQAEKELADTTQRLVMEQVELRKKNIALEEVLKEIEKERSKASREIKANIEKVIMPLLDSLPINERSEDYNTLYILKNSLRNLLEPFVSQLETRYKSLSPRELQICTMIRNGYSSKEIAEIFNTSSNTVIDQRKSIRRKLGIKDKRINLYSFLKTCNNNN